MKSERLQRSRLGKKLWLMALLGLWFIPPSTSWAFALYAEEEIHLVRGDLEVVEAKALERVSVSDPQIADIANIESDHVLLLAKSKGHTNLFLWDEKGKRSYVVRVFDDNLELVKSRLEHLLMRAEIYGLDLAINQSEGKVIVSGEIDEKKANEFEMLLDPFRGSLLNLVKQKEGEDLIQIDAMIAEISSSFTKTLGVSWTGLSALSYAESDYGNKKIDDADDIFKLGDFKRTTQIIGTINAAITEGKGRVLSKPKLVVVSGEEANFLVGGQVPITSTTTSTGGNVTENVDYRDYGVTLTVSPTLRNPTLREKSKIQIDLNIEVSDLDPTNSVGNNTAFTTRNTETKLMLDNRQSVVIAGLLKQTEGETVSRIPFLSDIPVVGALFRNRSHTPDTETELVVTLTPIIIPQKEWDHALQPQDTTVSIGAPRKVYTEETYVPPPVRHVESPARVVSAGEPEDITYYVRALQQDIAGHIVYPPVARQYGWEGTVRLTLIVLKDGTLAHADVSESSGYHMFDEHALKIAKGLAPFSDFPPDTGLEEITITIPIVYSLE